LTKNTILKLRFRVKKLYFKILFIHYAVFNDRLGVWPVFWLYPAKKKTSSDVIFSVFCMTQSYKRK